jgi:hypothetical protein
VAVGGASAAAVGGGLGAVVSKRVREKNEGKRERGQGVWGAHTMGGLARRTQPG